MIKIIKSPWLESTPKDLRGSCGEDTEIIKASVESGAAHLYHMIGGGVDLWVVTRGEESSCGLELVVCCVGGFGMKKAGEAIKSVAIQNGFNSIRYHSKNAAVQRLYEKYGIAGVELERVYRVELGGSA